MNNVDKNVIKTKIKITMVTVTNVDIFRSDTQKGARNVSDDKGTAFIFLCCEIVKVDNR